MLKSSQLNVWQGAVFFGYFCLFLDRVLCVLSPSKCRTLSLSETLFWSEIKSSRSSTSSAGDPYETAAICSQHPRGSTGRSVRKVRRVCSVCICKVLSKCLLVSTTDLHVNTHAFVYTPEIGNWSVVAAVRRQWTLNSPFPSAGYLTSECQRASASVCRSSFARRLPRFRTSHSSEHVRTSCPSSFEAIVWPQFSPSYLSDQQSVQLSVRVCANSDKVGWFSGCFLWKFFG